MKFSLNQIDQTSRKAARGCGLPWGVADEVGKAMRWLHEFRLDGVGGLVSLLERYDHHNPEELAPSSLNGKWEATGGVLSPLLVGPSLGDCQYMLLTDSIRTGKIAHPLLAAGFLGQSVLHGPLSVKLGWAQVTLEITGNQMAVSGCSEDLNLATSEGLVCQRTTVSGKVNCIELRTGGVGLGQDIWGRLEKFAHETYNEATEASRLSGAGAGLSDND